MIWEIRWTAVTGITRVTLCISGESTALKYALMRESQGYTVEIEQREWDTTKALNTSIKRIELGRIN